MTLKNPSTGRKRPVDALAGIWASSEALRRLLRRAKAAAAASSPTMETVAGMGAMLRRVAQV